MEARWLDKYETPAALSRNPFQRMEKWHEFVLDVMSCGSSHMKKVEEELSYIVNTGLDVDPVGNLARAVVDKARRIYVERNCPGRSLNT